MALREAQVFTITANPTDPTNPGDIPDVPEPPIDYPPRIDSLNPVSVKKNTATTLQVTGDHFFVDSMINFNDADLVTTFVNEQTLRCGLSSSNTATRGSFPVYVSNPPGLDSNKATFTVT
jgi:hypothetical protein